jgi:hypothetical protein
VHCARGIYYSCWLDISISIIVLVDYGLLFCSVSDRPEAYAQTATPRVSTWTTWARKKKPGKVVEGFPGPKPRLGGLSLFQGPKH